MVHRLTGKQEIRRLLNQDRDWALYALADLDDGMFEQCEWLGIGEGLALVFHGLSIRPIFVMGHAAEVRQLLAELPTTYGYLNAQSHTLAAAEEIYAYRHRNEMARMMLGDFVPREGPAEPLGMEAQQEVEALFASGDGAGIAFSPSQLKAGFFRGVRENGDLIAVAGTHVVSTQEGVAGVGNVFVRSDRRGRGLAQTVLSATVAAVRQAGIPTIGLNVEHTNAAALHAYEKLGFRTRFSYFEGMADKRI